MSSLGGRSAKPWALMLCGRLIFLDKLLVSPGRTNNNNRGVITPGLLICIFTDNNEQQSQTDWRTAGITYIQSCGEWFKVRLIGGFAIRLTGKVLKIR